MPYSKVCLCRINYALSLFVNNQFGVFSVCFVGADQQKIHIGSNAEAVACAKFAFKLVAKIGCVVIKEFDHYTVWQTVFEVYISAYKGVEVFYPRHSFDM